MSNYIKLINNLDYLKLDTFKQNIDLYIDLVNKGVGAPPSADEIVKRIEELI